jgi:hypothetical protein
MWHCMNTVLTKRDDGIELQQIFFVDGSTEGDVKVRFRIYANASLRSQGHCIAEMHANGRWNELATLPGENMITDGKVIYRPAPGNVPALAHFQADRIELLYLADLILCAGGETKKAPPKHPADIEREMLSPGKKER